MTIGIDRQISSSGRTTVAQSNINIDWRCYDYSSQQVIADPGLAFIAKLVRVYGGCRVQSTRLSYRKGGGGLRKAILIGQKGGHFKFSWRQMSGNKPSVHSTIVA